MVICHCKVINDIAIRRLLMTGRTSIEEVTAQCGAGGQCGGCVEAIQRLIDDETPIELSTVSAGG